ncbi:MAG: aldehyde dehydrogenase family protein [Bacteroidales bacterium]|nr:aldehyde dehydrogenase family protein [Bacteroidales bacterium]
MIGYKIYIGGRFATTQTVLEVTNPYSKKVFAKTYLAGADELEKAISGAESVKEEMQNLPSYRRYEILRQISDTINERREDLANVLVRESGKPIRYALGEVDRASQTFLIAAEESKRLPGGYISIDWTPKGEGKEGWIKYFPVGMVAGISPFNFPLNLAVHKIAPAIASGNTIILKPARSTPLSVLELAKIIDKTSLPKGALSILPMDRKAGNQLVTDERFKLLSFTGSPAVGWKMKQGAGKKKVLLELGGNAGVIISASANIDLAVEKCLVGSFAYSGQVCIHVQRIFVHDCVFEEFKLKFLRKVKGLKTGDPLNQETEISVMIDEENAERVDDWVKEAVENGAEILCGGARKESFFEPTVLTSTRPEMKVCSFEIFGPVITLEKFKSFNEAVNAVNNSKYGLQAGVFTNALNEMDMAFNDIETGGVILNDVPTFRVDHMPYGGVKNSGLGREGVKYSMFEMMEPRLLVKGKGE